MTDRDRGAGYRPDIDGLRALAVLGVLAFHAFPDQLSGGFVGVDVFFVVSGFLISGIVERELDDGAFRLTSFWARRARRILPALAIVLATCLVAGWILLLPLDYARLGKHTAGSATFSTNFALWREANYFDVASDRKPLLHLWSLAIEEQFYLAWPLLLLGAHKLRLRPVLVAGIVLVGSLACNVVLEAKEPGSTFYAPWTRAWELALGAVLVRASRAPLAPALRHVASVAGGVTIFGSMFVLNRLMSYPGWAACLPTLGTSFVILAGPSAALNRALAWRPFVAIGLISYPLYLWHWPALAFARLRSLDTPEAPVRAGLLLISAIAAWLTFRLVEMPIRRSPRSRTVVWLAGTTALLGALGMTIHARHGLSSRIPEPLRQYVTVAYDPKADVNTACWPSGDDPSYPDECLDQRRRGPLTFLWGDSHAARFSAGLRIVLGDGPRIAQYTRSGCPPLIERGSASCRAANAFVLEKIRQAKPEVVMLSANWLQHGRGWSRTDEELAQLQRTLERIREAGAGRIVVLGPVPQWRDDLPRVLALATFQGVGRREIPRRMTFGVEPIVADVDAALAASLRTEDRVSYVSTSKLLCDDHGCLTRVDDTPEGLTTWDYGHLTTKGATRLTEAIVAAHPDVFPAKR